MKKLSEAKVAKWRKDGSLQRVYKIIKQPVSKRFQKKYFSRQFSEITNKMKSSDIIKLAEVIRDTKGMLIEDEKSIAWKNLYINALTFMKYYISVIENIEQDQAFLILMSKLSDKTLEQIKNERKKIQNLSK